MPNNDPETAGDIARLDPDLVDVASLPSATRRSVVAHLLRWGQYDAAGRWLDRLLDTLGEQVSLYDDLARVHLGRGEPEQALKIMDRRHALGVSNSSRILEAEIHLAAGNLAAAQAIARELTGAAGEMATAWMLQADVCLAAADFDGAEAAVRRRETLVPEAAATAHALSRLWKKRGDPEKALLWARTALSRHERDGREPAVALLRLLEELYRVAGQEAQAVAVVARLEARRQGELAGLIEVLRAFSLVPVAPIPEPDRPLPPGAPSFPLPPDVVTGRPVPAEELAPLEAALHRFFPHNAFRPGQAEVVAALLRGESVLAVMPTGAGKSLCYQLAALLLPRTTLVISPLIALMKDQLDGLPAEVAHQATAINSTLDGAELEARLAAAAAGRYKLVYAAPERLRQRPFLHALQRAGISLLVVDEAHCVSLWGHDFRPDYRFIAAAWQEMGHPPLLAMTATATPRVRDDVQASLGAASAGRQPLQLVAIDTHRPNLRLEARRLDNDAGKQRALLAMCRQVEGSGIVYAQSRDKCESLAAILRSEGLSAIHYHAGIDDRAAAQDRFMSGQARIVVATVAFGMGIDKSDVRFIVHYHPPRSLESYYQEAGRAGRDGRPSHCILFHTAADRANLRRWNNQDALSLEFLRQVYAAVRQRLGGRGLGLVAAADLERDLDVEETQVRVAIHFLENAGLLWRGFDLPRAASLRLHGDAPAGEPDLALLAATARLRPGQIVSRDLMSLWRDAADGDAQVLDPRTVEARLLAWQDGGWLEYRGTGRDMLLAVPPAPADSSQRVNALLADHRAGQDARVAEMMAYAETRRCRHGHIGAYFAGQHLERCQSCDNCQGGTAFTWREPGTVAGSRPASARRSAPRSRPAPGQTPAVADPAGAILEAVAQLPFALGRTGLARALQGAASSTVGADRLPLFGTLSHLTLKAIRALADELHELGYLEQYDRDGYRLLRLAARGRAWLGLPPAERPPLLAPQGAPAAPATHAERSSPAPQNQQAAPAADSSTLGVDEGLFQRLRAWRLDKAREKGQAPFIIFHDRVLREIAARRPASMEELLEIRGVGPGKAEAYGAQVLAVVAARPAE